MANATIACLKQILKLMLMPGEKTRGREAESADL